MKSSNQVNGNTSQGKSQNAVVTPPSPKVLRNETTRTLSSGDPPKTKRGGTTFGSNTSKMAISAVESRRHIFVSRLHPNTSTEQLSQHLLENSIPILDVERLDTVSKEIAAFKVQVAYSDVKKIYNPDIWPKYTIIRPYRAPKNMEQNFRRDVPQKLSTVEVIRS